MKNRYSASESLPEDQRALAINGRFLAQAVSGVQRYGRELVQALDRVLAEGMPCCFSSATVWVPPNVAAEMVPSGLQVLQIKRAGRLSGHLWEQIELPRLARRAVLVNLTNSAPLLHRCQVVALHDAAIAEYPDDFRWAYRTWYRVLYAGLRRTSAQFITVSSFAAGEIARHFGIASDRIAVVPNAAEHFLGLVPDRSILARLKLSGHDYILAVGGRSHRKNLAVLERAMAQLDPCPTLVVVAGGKSRAFSGDGAVPLAHCVFLDHISDEAIKALYQSALCLVFPSRYEGFGLPPLEAMACGCPVIVSSAASMPEICGDAALYGDPDNPDSFADSIRLMLADPGLRNRLIVSGADRARLFSWESSARRLLDIARQQGMR